MKSLLSVIFYALCALGALGVFLYQSGSGRLTGFLGKPALPSGIPLFSFEKKAISRITITNDQGSTSYSRRFSFWTVEESENAIRADYQQLDNLLYMLESATIVSELESAHLVTETPHSAITLRDDQGLSLIHI